jgi:hypothetical protein
MLTSTKNGWLTAKKRGRDDEQIDRDRKLAMLQRQDKKRKGKGATASEAVVAGKGKNSKNNSRSRASFETLDSLADFVIDDDSVTSEGEEEASVDDEELLVDDDISSSSSEDKNKTKKSAVAKKRVVSARDEILSMSSSDTDDDEDCRKISSFFSKSLKKYSSKPASLIQKPQRVASKADSKKVKMNRSHSSLKEPKVNILGCTISATDQHVISLDNSDSDMDDRKIPACNPKFAATSKISEESGKEKGSCSDSCSLMSSSELFNVAETSSSSPLPKLSQKSGTYVKETLLDLEDTPLVPSAIRKKIKKYQPPTSTTSKRTKKDNDISMEQANVPIDLQDSSGDENEEEGMGADFVDTEEYNEDAVAAQSILATTNELSLLILRTMASWTHGAVDGMIVDGALALSTITNGNDCEQRDVEHSSETTLTTNQKADHKWISNDAMLQILPNVRLSEYQLIGINWLALLHGMRCEVVGGTKKEYTNVNGILADGSSFVRFAMRFNSF